MKVEARFVRQVGMVLLLAALLLGYPLIRYASSDVILGVILGAAASTLNALLGFFAVEYSFDKSYTVFLRTVLGGMGLRMLLMLGALAGLILFFHIHTVALTVSMLGFYLIFLILEVFFIQRKVLVKNQG